MTLIVIKNEDCIPAMKQMVDKSIDLILTDPPYGILPQKTTIGGEGVCKNNIYPLIDWDIKITQEQINELVRVSKNQVIFGAEHISHLLPQSRGWYCWDKLRPEGTTFSECEFIWTSFDQRAIMIRFMWNGMIRANIDVEKEERYHPTQKPIEVIRQLIKNHSKPGDLICDPFMGSGTTAVACNQLGRRFIGFEISAEYCEIAKRRLNQESLLQHTLSKQSD